MIPVLDIRPTIPDPLPACEMPHRDDISEEGFGWFRGTWFMGRVPISEATEVVQEEAEMISWLQRVSTDADEFELLASAIENPDEFELPGQLRERASASGIEAFLGDFASLGSLEIGVAGLAHALSAIGCLTAASCRAHSSERSWADCPVVFFAAPAWRISVLSDLIQDVGCGLEADRDMLKIYGRSILDTHRLAQHIVCERGRFRKRPDSSGGQPRRSPRVSAPKGTQLDLPIELASDSE